MNRLRELREDNDWTLQYVADLLGTHNTTISKYELGDRALTDELINKFCDIYDCTADYLLCRSNQRHPAVSNPDTELLHAYHSAPAPIRAAVDGLLEPYKETKNQDADNSAAS